MQKIFLLFGLVLFSNLHASGQKVAIDKCPIPVTDTVTEVPLENVDLDSNLQFWDIPNSFQKNRFIPVASSAVLLYTGSLYSLNKSWYSQYPKSDFHTYDDWGEWRNMDKVGHLYAGYFQTRTMMDMFEWTGVGKNRSILLGGLCGMAFQSVIETLDGFSAEWGWSWTDMGANAIGTFGAMSQKYFWDEQRIQVKFSAHVNQYPGDLNLRADTLYGKGNGERILKDYNAQTYWFSANPWSFRKESKFPKWLNLAVGVGADGMFGGNSNTWIDDNGVEQSINLPRYTQWYLSPDIDLTKIKTKRKGIRFALYLLNIIKVPLPTMEYNRVDGVKFHAFYF